MSINKIAALAAASLVSLAFAGVAHAQQQSGVVSTSPPEDIFLTVTLGASGETTLSQTDFKLALGGYYRFNLECPGKGTENEAGFSFVAPDLWENSHLRLVSVSDPKSGFKEAPEINFHVQGLQIREIECEGFQAAARFSFYPMKKGKYDFTVVNDTVKPDVTVKGTFTVE